MNLKNLIPLLFLIFCISETQSQNLRFGLMAGIGATQIKTGMGDMITGNESYNPYAYDPMLNFNVNAITELRFLRWFGLALEPGYIIKGGNTATLDGEDATYKINYMQLPVLGEFYLAERFCISFGPEFSYALSANYKTDGNSSDVTEELQNKNEISGLLGMHFMVSEKLGIGLRYGYGFTKVNEIVIKDIYGLPFGVYDEHNQYLQLNVRWYFN